MAVTGPTAKKQFVIVLGLNGLISLVVWFYITTYPGLIWSATSSMTACLPAKSKDLKEWKAENLTNSFSVEVNFEPTDNSKTYRDRNTLLYEKCETLPVDRVRGRRPIYFFAKSKSLAFCKVPKAGSTFVGTVVAALELRKKPGNMFHMSLAIVHGQNEVDFSTLSKYSSSVVKKILVTRNPYTRLFSAFTDKYFVLGARPKTIATKKGKGRFEMRNGYCGYDISFQEFLDYFTDLHIAGKEVEEHTMPVSSLCYPCMVHYNILCKQETLTADIEYVLSVTNISEPRRQTVMELIRSKSLNDTIYASVSYHMLYFNLYPNDCSSKILLMEKVWKVFQLQGYISLSLTFPINSFQNLTDFDAENVTTLILEQIQSRPLSKSQMSKQRQIALAEAYSSIKPSTIARVQRMFAQDFHLFGYDKTIPTRHGKNH
ncbi:uncharacterized protein LOC110449800 [Mizuhopecten yessoensis]|uniref:Carbohydrate sulfotransferase n=1 Tax=Mizuhopecten yessoensis TaxID=6573 RepID=A0A210QQJ3_MIZYE|nr:uncharacterized protein LOC110449800 [Mizuhopecten yessoensis]OWF51002.1 Carbohydrate sulfotransferase 11 [Mizuhopecten yessoensis]